MIKCFLFKFNDIFILEVLIENFFGFFMVNKKWVIFVDILGFLLVFVVEIYFENWFFDRIFEKYRF